MCSEGVVLGLPGGVGVGEEVDVGEDVEVRARDGHVCVSVWMVGTERGRKILRSGSLFRERWYGPDLVSLFVAMQNASRDASVLYASDI